MANVTETQWYTETCGTCRFTLPIRYTDLVFIGQGAFGVVIQAMDSETHKKVAIKKIATPFQSVMHAKRAYRELYLLMNLNHQDAQMVQLYNVFTPEQNQESFQTIYIVMNFFDYNLNEIISRRLSIPESHITHIIYSILLGLKYIHSAGVIHRDLKPANIGIDQEYNVAILDFGLARTRGVDINLTNYVCTRWWRAPEIIIDNTKYNEKIDVWSVGCIMAELILLRPLFPGDNSNDQLNKIVEIIGTPNTNELNEMDNTESSIYAQFEQKSPQDFNILFGCRNNTEENNSIQGISSTGIDFLRGLLTLNHRRRFCVQQALDHPFLKNNADPDIDITSQPLIDKHEDQNYDLKQWKNIIWELIQNFIPPNWINDHDNEDSMDINGQP